jgi:hypothetical protein
MRNPTKKLATIVLGCAVFTGVLLFDGSLSANGAVAFVAPAHAVVGRPLTPVSYAGVARRTTRRAVVATAAARPVVVAAPTTVVVAAPTVQTCVDTVNANGSITRICR